MPWRSAGCCGEVAVQYRSSLGQSRAESLSWKIIRAISSENPEKDQHLLEEKADGQSNNDRGLVSSRSRIDLVKQVKPEKPKSLNNLPTTNLNARWESIQTMMEMSDVGVFEYNSSGKLMHANEAWYRLRYVQRHHQHLYNHVTDFLQLSPWNTRAFRILFYGPRLS